MAMLPGAIDAAKLARALRLEDVLLSAAAVPLPIDLSPSRLPEPNLDTTDASTDAKDAHPSASATVEAQGVQGVNASVAERAPADASAQDAVVKSLQAAHDAIHDSLQSNGGDEPAPDVANVDPVPASPAGTWRNRPTSCRVRRTPFPRSTSRTILRRCFPPVPPRARYRT
jgi:hypothetical protein